MLPQTIDDAVVIHTKLRDQFFGALSAAQITRRPWIWAAGDNEADDLPGGPPPSTHASDPEVAIPDVPQVPFAVHSTNLSMYEPAMPRAATNQDDIRCRSHNCISIDARIDLINQKGLAMADDEIRYHVMNLIQSSQNVALLPHAQMPGFVFLDPLIIQCWHSIGADICRQWCRRHTAVKNDGVQIVAALLQNEHWIPLWATPSADALTFHLIDEARTMSDEMESLFHLLADELGFSSVAVHWIPSRLPEHEMCGAFAISFLAHLIVSAPLPESLDQLRTNHTNMRASFVQAVYTDQCCRCPVAWGLGPSALHKALVTELLKHGVPDEVVETRAVQAVNAIGADKIQQALDHRQTWRQLKQLGNHVRFQFLLPSELDKVIQQNGTKPVGHKSAKRNVGKIPQIPDDLTLDPTKLRILDGCFRCNGHVVPQILSQQIGPLASGVVLMTLADAEPYLRAGSKVSQDPLALLVFPTQSKSVVTALPHTGVTVPCRCAINNEPVLVEAVLVQLGQGWVSKHQDHRAIALDDLEVCTAKFLVYRDEVNCKWDEFVAAPIKCIVGTFPILKRCFVDGCQCDCWHNPDDLSVRDPILDVWRRQYFKQNFKPCKSDEADFFAVCIRIPTSLLERLLEQSGFHGFYVEPRSADGKEILNDYVVIWTPKHSTSELLHLKQTNAAILGLARASDRRGVRVISSQAQQIHELIRPDSMFLPQGQRLEFLAGPFPYGIDRHAICKALKLVGWSTKPLQPSTPVAGKGNMWIIHAIETPPENIVCTTHGEIVITSQQKPEQSKLSPVHPVGSASTLSLCGSSSNSGDTDPWSKADPWGGYKPSHAPAPVPVVTPSESLTLMQERIQNAVLAKLPTAPDSDAPARLTALESQVQQLMTKQTSIETSFNEFTNSNAVQLHQMRNQIESQNQQIHGQLEHQSQSMQALFENQMQQIRGLLSKRPREDAAME